MEDSLKAILLELKNELQKAQGLRRDHVKKNMARLKEVRTAHVKGEPGARLRVNEACLYWIEHGTWPAVHLDAVYVWERLNSGYLFGAWLYSCGFRSLPAQRNTILKFLLVWQWESCGRLQGAWRNPQDSGPKD